LVSQIANIRSNAASGWAIDPQDFGAWRMQALRTVFGAALGLALTVSSLVLMEPARGPSALALATAAAHALQAPARDAEVSVVFDHKGRPLAHALRRSSGSQRSDQAAVSAAMELASLRHPCEVAGRTLLFTARFD
jgi:hypothetical protein